MTTALTAAEREVYIATYVQGIDELEAAYSESPAEALHHKPAPHEWSIQEIVCHCADAEIVGAVRVRMLAAEPEPVLQAIDQDLWAQAFSYESLSSVSALALVRAVRSHTASILRSLPEEVWTKVGTHTEIGPYAITTWLTYWADHLHVHAEQIRANVRDFEARQ
jgi:hypothetical protein